ncbi:VanZ family protein [Dactylosporangium sp. AC04546]|uniref:VanZ family protein n=1 Tax=Dactylosporangium sp. AC04546 TaxID=2862460 RepID=UPI001EE0C62C|nr:VanZ family protein [Dactylosporangium sp. AC04546]WVK82431.1 VanZ family protein [Dactylosporangium sp. AC04546]
MRRRLAVIGVIAGTLPWVVMILIPTPRGRRVNLDPVQGLADVLTGDPWTAVVQMGGNLAVFAAFGALGPIAWRIGPWAVTALAAGGSLTLEILQYLLDLGRVSAVDDVIVNAAGAGLAALLTRRWHRRRTAEPPSPSRSAPAPQRTST